MFGEPNRLENFSVHHIFFRKMESQLLLSETMGGVSVILKWDSRFIKSNL